MTMILAMIAVSLIGAASAHAMVRTGMRPVLLEWPDALEEWPEAHRTMRLPGRPRRHTAQTWHRRAAPRQVNAATLKHLSGACGRG